MARYETSVRKSELSEGKPVKVDINGKAVVLALISGKIYAMDAVCSHEGGPLDEGTIEGHSLICPWHQGIFDIRTAKASPATDWVTDLRSYTVVVDENSGLISVETNSGASHLDASNPGSSQRNTALTADSLPAKPLKLQLRLLERNAHQGTDIMSFRFSRGDGQNFLNYRAGQYSVVDLGTDGDPKGPTRSFTIASSPTERDSILITTRIRNSPFKQKLSRLEAGAAVKITAPAGDFTLPDDYSKPLVFLSGGIGVTPFRSMVRFATDEQLPVKITMFDSNRNRANILYKDEFDSWARLDRNLRIVYTITGEESESPTSRAISDWEGEKGQVDKSMLMKYLNKDELSNSTFCICGPPGMPKGMQDLLQKELQIPERRIRVEEFTGY
jgi:ferredoxin-NADP reductase/nitrite reductase/ring-hydroxylating ferredoxin subunit